MSGQFVQFNFNSKTYGVVTNDSTAKKEILGLTAIFHRNNSPVIFNHDFISMKWILFGPQLSN